MTIQKDSPLARTASTAGRTLSDVAGRNVRRSLAWLDGLKNAPARLVAGVADLLFPPHCVACKRFGAWLCPACLQQIETIHPPVCRRCGLPMTNPDSTEPSLLMCDRCRRLTGRDQTARALSATSAPSQLDGLLAYAFHGGPLRQAIHDFKYQGLRDLADLFGKLMSDGWASLAPHDLNPDVIVPVPLHASRQRQRGYNQAALLAREFGAHLQRPVIENVLIRSIATAPQVDLNVQERHANVRGAFQCTGTSLAGMQVLLVDDVCTTGATLESACVALRETGTSSVWAYTLARAKPHPDTDPV